MADDNLNMETTKFKITLSQDENQNNIATFEATRQDFVSYRLIIREDEVTTKTQGVFQKLSPLVKNSKILLIDQQQSSFLSIKKSFEKENIVLVFTSDLLESSFTLLLPKIETSLVELLLKRVEKLEAQIQAVPQLVFEAEYTGELRLVDSNQNYNIPFQKVNFIQENLINYSEEKGVVTVNQPGRYQIIFFCRYPSLRQILCVNGRYLHNSLSSSSVGFVGELKGGGKIFCQGAGGYYESPGTKLVVMKFID